MILYTGATFDLFHAGHVNFLRQCRAIAGPDGRVVVALNTDDFVERFKGHRPVVDYWAREAVVAACRYVDAVVMNWGDEDSRPAIEAVRPDIIAASTDWFSPDDSRYCRQMGMSREWLAERGIRLIYVPYTPGISSTALRAAVKVA